MSDFAFTIVRSQDGLVTSSGQAGSDLQLQTQFDYCPEGHEIHAGIEIMPGWRYVDGEFVPPSPEPVTVEMVKREAGRRLKYTDWYVTRAADPTDGRPVPESVLAERAALRAAAERLEAMVPIPPDYRSEEHWT